MGRRVFNDSDAVSLRDADVVPPLSFHLGQDGSFRRTQIHTASVSRLQVMIRKGRDGPKSRHETRQALPAWLYAEMADRLLFSLASGLDVLEDGPENFAGDKLVAGEHRTILYVIETALRCIGKPLHHRTPDDAVLVL